MGLHVALGEVLREIDELVMVDSDPARAGSAQQYKEGLMAKHVFLPTIEEQGQIRDRGRCVYCDSNVYRSLGSFCGFTNDHLVPEAHYGRLKDAGLLPPWLDDLGSLANHATACTGCNVFAGSWVPGADIRNMSRDDLIATKRKVIRGRQEARYGPAYERRARLIEEAD